MFFLHRQWKSLRLQTRRAGPLSCGHRCEHEDVFSPSVLLHLVKPCTSTWLAQIRTWISLLVTGWWIRPISFHIFLRWGRGLPLYNSIRLHLHQHVQGNLFKPHEKSKHGIIMAGLITFSTSFDSFQLLWQFWQPLLNKANNINNPADFVNTYIQSQRQSKHVLKN